MPDEMAEEKYPYTDPQRITGKSLKAHNQQLRGSGKRASRPEGESQDINRKPDTYTMPKPDFMTYDQHYEKVFGTKPPKVTMPKAMFGKDQSRKKKKGK